MRRLAFASDEHHNGNQVPYQAKPAQENVAYVHMQNAPGEENMTGVIKAITKVMSHTVLFVQQNDCGV